MSQLSGGTRIGVVGEHPAVLDAIEAAGGTPQVGDAGETAAADVDAVVAVGEAALYDLVPAGVDVPVLPVDAGRAVRSVPGMAVEPAVSRLLDGEFQQVDLPVLRATTERGATRALADLALVPGEPARISEYAVTAGGESVSTVRADGVVVATPVGSRGYARAAGGPVVALDADVVTVVPVSPFAIDTDHWVVPPELSLRVERDETPVELLADGRRAAAVDPDEPVDVAPDGHLTVAVTAESYGSFETP